MTKQVVTTTSLVSNSRDEMIRFLTGIAQSVTARRACDGRPAARHRVQRLNFSEGSVTVRHTCDGPSHL